MIQRKAEFKELSKDIDAWALQSPECPLKEALDTLGQKPRSCIMGVVTNVQGAVPLTKCEFYGGDKTLTKDPMTIGCKKRGKT
jgi:hypothetical protein